MAESLTTGKIALQMFEESVETYESQQDMVKLCTSRTPDGAPMQNSGNIEWVPIQQNRYLTQGWDQSSVKRGIIQQEYPRVLTDPWNDWIEQRADDRRDASFWIKAAQEGIRKQASGLNSAILSAISVQGSLHVRTNDTSGYDAISGAQVLMNERQAAREKRFMMLNDRDTRKFGADLAARQTVVGLPEEAYTLGRIGEQVAEFDIYTSSANPLIAGGAAVDTTVTGDQSFKPEAGTVADSAAGTVTNVDYRNATIPVAASASYNVGDKVTITNPLGTVKSIGLDTKQSTGQAMTFTIKAKPTGTSLIISPKPIAADDSALSDLEKASANIDTIILDTATVNRVNTDTSVQTNIFWDKSAVEIVGGTLPADKFKEFGGMKQLSETLSNGLTLYCFWDGNIETLTFDYRCFLWYGVNIANPSNCGVMTTY